MVNVPSSYKVHSISFASNPFQVRSLEWEEIGSSMGGRGEAQRRHERNESGLRAQQAHSPRHRLGNENGRTSPHRGKSPTTANAYALSGWMKSHWI